MKISTSPWNGPNLTILNEISEGIRYRNKLAILLVPVSDKRYQLQAASIRSGQVFAHVPISHAKLVALCKNVEALLPLIGRLIETAKGCPGYALR